MDLSLNIFFAIVAAGLGIGVAVFIVCVSVAVAENLMEKIDEAFEK